jgi:tetratricopeptide (TPR) repeat protein
LLVPARALSLRSVKVALVASFAIGVALCFSPLLGTHGVESALVLGIVLPPFVAWAAAAMVVHQRRLGVVREPLVVLLDAARLSLAIVAVPFVVLALDQLRVKNCTPWLGLAFEVLGPGFGAVAAGVLGAVIALFVRRPRLARWLAVLLPIAAIATGVHRFWDSPAIFVYGLFAGFFPGTIYDEGVTIPGAYLTFRAATCALVLGAALVASAASAPASGGVDLARVRARVGRALFGVALLALFVAAEANGEVLGHRSSAEFIAEELGATLEGERCIVHVPRELPRRDLERLERDCSYRVARAEAVLGVRQRARVHAFFFRNAEEKSRYMGAATTYIAKPWRNEVYLQLAGWPHPVLFHEIVHVVAGNAAEGPFRVGGHLGGFLPDPALIEGVAVAVAWDARDDLTPHQWAKAMIELDMMPPLDDVIGLSFLGQPARNAYTVAGSFLRYLLDEHGAEAVREAYRTGDVEAATGETIATLEARWREHLEGVPLPAEALSLARVRFSHRSIFSAVCPHRLARLRAELGGDIAAGDTTRAIETCEEILEIDPNDVATRALYAGTLARDGQRRESERELEALTRPPAAPEPIQVLAEQAVADAAWLRGDARAALSSYRALLARPQTEDAARNLEVRILAIESGGVEGARILDMLVGIEGLPTPPTVAVHHAREITEARSDGLGAYLEARQMMFAGRYDLALPLIRDALDRGLPTSRLERENRRMLGTTLFATGQLEEAGRLHRRILDDLDSTPGDRVTSADWIDRIQYTREHGR